MAQCITELEDLYNNEFQKRQQLYHPITGWNLYRSHCSPIFITHGNDADRREVFRIRMEIFHQVIRTLRIADQLNASRLSCVALGHKQLMTNICLSILKTLEAENSSYMMDRDKTVIERTSNGDEKRRIAGKEGVNWEGVEQGLQLTELFQNTLARLHKI
ncbi:hypothetical protein FBU30_001969 [Linnemannia zychae]|nr:hypothetical protein FBU30_001969 [Linnemannia zychae]